MEGRGTGRGADNIAASRLSVFGSVAWISGSGSSSVSRPVKSMMKNLLTTMAETRAIPMLHPVHPGVNILFGCLGVVGEDEGAITVAEAAAKLGVSSEALQRVVDGHAPVTPDLARRMEAAGWSTAEFWMRLQASYDEAFAKGKHRAASA